MGSGYQDLYIAICAAVLSGIGALGCFVTAFFYYRHYPEKQQTLIVIAFVCILSLVFFVGFARGAFFGKT